VAIFFRKITAPFAAAVHWVFAEDIDATYNELKSTGANIVEPLEKKPWGLRQFTVEDIDGNRFYFHHDYPSAASRPTRQLPTAEANHFFGKSWGQTRRSPISISMPFSYYGRLSSRWLL
jgi:hypothetical protein